MSENREKREEQIQRLARILGDFRDAGGDPHEVAAAILFPDPPTPAAPEVLVTRESDDAAMGAWRRDGFMASALRAAFPHLLAANPWAVDAEIRRRVKALSTTIWYPPAGTGQPLVRMPRADGVGPVVSRADLLAALGVTP